MLEKYTELRDKVRQTNYKTFDYEECVRLSSEYITRLKNEDTEEDLSEDFLIAYYHLALGYKKTNRNKLALKYAFIALKYTKPFQIDYNLIMTKWLLAEIKHNLGDDEYAIKTYLDCEKMFDTLNQKRYSTCMRFNIYKIQMNDIEMKKLIKEFEDYIISENKSNYTYLDEAQKDNFLQEMYLELSDIYIIKHKTEELFEMLKNIKNKNLKKEISNKLVA